jgi:hypothetical protein
MKSNISLIFALFASLSAFSAHAEKVGNGGVAVVCRNLDGKITDAELLDLFEGRNQLSLTFPNRSLGIDLEIDIAKTKMVSNPIFLSHFQNEVSSLKAAITFLPRGIGLEPTNDAFPIINKRGCKFENVANYSNDGKVYIDSEIFDILSPINQAALYIHEAVYALARKTAEETSSIRARKMTAYILASTSNLGVVETLMDAFLNPQINIPKLPLAFSQIKSGHYISSGNTICNFRITKDENAGKMFLFWEGGYCKGKGAYIALTCDDSRCIGTEGEMAETPGICPGADPKAMNMIYYSLRTLVPGKFEYGKFVGPNGDNCKHRRTLFTLKKGRK